MYYVEGARCCVFHMIDGSIVTKPEAAAPRHAVDSVVWPGRSGVKGTPDDQPTTSLSTRPQPTLGRSLTGPS